jgi:hypothetical protein
MTIDKKYLGDMNGVGTGQMSKNSQSLNIVILEGSGGGALLGISGSLVISQDEEGHSYELDFQFTNAE